MAGSFADALSNAGLISDQEKNTILADQAGSIASREAMLKTAFSKKNHAECLVAVYICPSVGEFKISARKILNENPELIGEVLKSAHRFKGRQGGDRLIWLCYQVRDHIGKIPAEKREQFLKRAFRGANGTIAIPE